MIFILRFFLTVKEFSLIKFSIFLTIPHDFGSKFHCSENITLSVVFTSHEMLCRSGANVQKFKKERELS